jgi:high frequency lysogenization protein
MALAGIAQSVLLVDQLARTGDSNPEDIEPCIDALLCQNPETVQEVFGSFERFGTGLRSLPEIFGLRNNSRQLPMRYLVQSLHLQRVFLARDDMVGVVAAGLDDISRRRDSAPDKDMTALCADIGDLYQRTLSTLSFRIQVHGQHQYLQLPDVANRIRCMLFSAIRFSLLWHQLGGKRRDFLFAKKVIGEQARTLLKSH